MKREALERDAVTKFARHGRSTRRFWHKKNDATALLQERHDPIRQLAAVLHVGFTEFKKAQIEFSMQL